MIMASSKRQKIKHVSLSAQFGVKQKSTWFGKCNGLKEEAKIKAYEFKCTILE